MAMSRPIRVGDLIKVVRAPSELHDASSIGTPGLFERILGKTVRVDGVGECGYLELRVNDDGTQTPDACENTIWIEPEFVERVADSPLKS